jgi:Ni/Fe-hydrogenase subunit HybB-like protein
VPLYDCQYTFLFCFFSLLGAQQPLPIDNSLHTELCFFTAGWSVPVAVIWHSSASTIYIREHSHPLFGSGVVREADEEVHRAPQVGVNSSCFMGIP